MLVEPSDSFGKLRTQVSWSARQIAHGDAKFDIPQTAKIVGKATSDVQLIAPDKVSYKLTLEALDFTLIAHRRLFCRIQSLQRRP